MTRSLTDDRVSGVHSTVDGDSTPPGRGTRRYTENSNRSSLVRTDTHDRSGSRLRGRNFGNPKRDLCTPTKVVWDRNNDNTGTGVTTIDKRSDPDAQGVSVLYTNQTGS